MHSKIIDGKPYVLGEYQNRWSQVEIFDGEKFVPLKSPAGIDIHNNVLRNIYRRLDAVESRK